MLGRRTSDAEAIAELYERFVDPMYRYFSLRINSPEDAEDLTDQLFLKMIEALPTYKDRGAPFAAWLYRIAHNLVVDRYRRAGREPVRVDDAIPATGRDADPFAAAADALSRESITRALATLTEDQRDVIILRLVEGWNVEETAVIMKRTAGAIHAVQHRAVYALRTALDGAGEEVGSGAG